ncbi:MAG: diaminopimelate decarboxylase [Spirochaetes bacterium]|nr:diaminopimelate decarboxylase [Spirochaetota bacterium]
MEIKNNKLYLGDNNVEDLAKKYGTPLYVYEKSSIDEKIKIFKEAFKDIDNLKIYYAAKANSNLALMKIFQKENIGIDAVSPEEVQAALKIGYKPEEILFTGNNLTLDEMKFIYSNGVKINLNTLSEIEKFGALLKDLKVKGKTSVSISINPNVGGTQHPQTITGGPNSKFGIYYDKICEALDLAGKNNLIIDSVHSHIGSGILDVDMYMLSFNMVLETVEKIPNLKQINLGSGFGVKYHPKEKSMDFELLGKEINGVWRDFCSDYGSTPVLSFEPGKFLIAESGYLLAEVTSFNKTPTFEFVGINTGFNHLIRAMAYGSYHPIYNGSNLGQEGSIDSVVITGNLCDSRDIFTVNGHDPISRDIPSYKIGSIVVIAIAGAYGYSMSSNYNLRVRPAEVLVENGKSQIIREREKIENLLKDNCNY